MPTTNSEAFGKNFFPLSEEEVNIHQEFQKKLEVFDKYSKNIFTYLLNLKNTKLLVKLAEHNAILAEHCNRKEMEPYWNEVWRLMSRYPTFLEAEKDSTLAYRELVPQPGISSFDLVRGMILYDIAIEFFREGKKDSMLAFMQQAAHYKCYYAVSALSGFDYDCLQGVSAIESSELNGMLERIKSIILPHGTPAYLLLASMLITIAQYHQRRGDCAGEFGFYCEALKNLHAAQYSKEYSTAAIYNAYYGSAIARTRQFEIDMDDKKSISRYRETLGIKLDLNMQYNLMRTAHKEVEAQLTKYEAALKQKTLEEEDVEMSAFQPNHALTILQPFPN